MLLTLYSILLLFSAASFLFYGINSFTSNFIIQEFLRYGIPQYRKLTGWLQLLGALGIIIGFWINYIQILSTGGLALLMLFGVITRMLIKDSFLKTLPALLYCLLNTYLCIELITDFL